MRATGEEIGSVIGPFKTRAQAERAGKDAWGEQPWGVRMLNDYQTPTGRPMTLFYEDLQDPTLRKKDERVA